MNEILKQISDIGIVPVVVINDAKDALSLAEALIDGGLPCAEVTFRTPAAEEAIRLMSENFPEMLVGAGTVLTPEQADRAMKAGAKFLVSPGLNTEVVKHCIAKGYPITPGTANPSDIEAALSLGLDAVKFFPAEAAGGLAMIKAMSAPYPHVKFMPTGGISAKNVTEYLAFDKIFACGGSWMVKSDMIAAGDFEGIRKMTEEAVQTMLGFELAHIGINCETEDRARNTARQFENLFGFKQKDGNKSIFNDTFIEVMKFKFHGSKGHIGIKTNSVSRAVRYLKSKGVAFNEDSFAYDAKGKLKLAYLQDEIAGFAVHLTGK